MNSAYTASKVELPGRGSAEASTVVSAVVGESVITVETLSTLVTGDYYVEGTCTKSMPVHRLIPRLGR